MRYISHRGLVHKLNLYHDNTGYILGFTCNRCHGLHQRPVYSRLEGTSMAAMGSYG